MLIKSLLHFKRDCGMHSIPQSVKQYDNLQKFPNAASITRGVGLDKKNWLQVLSDEWDQ